MKTLEVSERVLRSNRLKPTDCFHLLVLDGGESVAVVPVSSEAVAEIDIIYCRFGWLISMWEA